MIGVIKAIDEVYGPYTAYKELNILGGLYRMVLHFADIDKSSKDSCMPNLVFITNIPATIGGAEIHISGACKYPDITLEFTQTLNTSSTYSGTKPIRTSITTSSSSSLEPMYVYNKEAEEYEKWKVEKYGKVGYEHIYRPKKRLEPPGSSSTSYTALDLNPIRAAVYEYLLGILEEDRAKVWAETSGECSAFPSFKTLIKDAEAIVVDDSVLNCDSDKEIERIIDPTNISMDHKKITAELLGYFSRVNGT